MLLNVLVEIYRYVQCCINTGWYGFEYSAHTYTGGVLSLPDSTAEYWVKTATGGTGSPGGTVSPSCCIHSCWGPGLNKCQRLLNRHNFLPDKLSSPSRKMSRGQSVSQMNPKGRALSLCSLTLTGWQGGSVDYRGLVAVTVGHTSLNTWDTRHKFDHVHQSKFKGGWNGFFSCEPCYVWL